MLTIPHTTLTDLICSIFVAAGTPDDIARYVAESLVTTNLTGHDSHGIIRVRGYIAQIRNGSIKPDAQPIIERQMGAIAVLDGRWGFGQVTARAGAALAQEIAAQQGIGCVALSNTNHIGRLGEYAEMIARAGMVSIVMTSGTMSNPSVTPYGGAQAVFGTNPMAWGVPVGQGQPPLLLDYATAAVANGKIKVALDKGEPFPEGMLLDKDGFATTNPADFYNGGMLLPFGTYKGYGLNLMMEIVPVLLAGFAPIISPNFKPGNPTLMLAFNVEAFTPRESFEHEAAALLRHIKQVRPAAGYDEVLLPGEKEARTMAERLENGIPLPEKTWGDLCLAAEEYGLDFAGAI